MLFFRSFDFDSVVLIYKSQTEARYAFSVMHQSQYNHDVIFLDSFGSDVYECAVCDYSIFVARSAALSRLTLSGRKILITTVDALNFKVPPPSCFMDWYELIVHASLSQQTLLSTLRCYGYVRVESVTERGQYAVRGGIVDAFPPVSEFPVRVDFCGNEIDLIRSFDPATQLSGANLESTLLTKCSEVILDDHSQCLFQQKYRGNDHRVRECVMNGNLFPGMEWYLSCFHEQTTSILDYFQPTSTKFTLGFEVEKYNGLFWDGLASKDGEPPVRDIFCDSVALVVSEFDVERVDPLSEIGTSQQHHKTYDIRKPGSLSELINELDRTTYKVVFSVTSTGTFNILIDLLKDRNVRQIENFFEAEHGAINVIISDLKQGSISDELAIYTEGELFGKPLKLVKKSSSRNVYKDYSKLSIGDYVVHEMHGIAMFDGLIQFDVSGVMHEFINLMYANGDRLYVPIENISVISRYGGSDTVVQLDSLKSSAWSRRRNGVRKKLLVIAGDLLKTAATRKLNKVEPLMIPSGFDKFCDGFGHVETDDQLTAISDVINDLMGDCAMDRLVCGDVGFGKTEVALRAAFVVASSGRQVVLLAPTTILVVQHFKTFKKRFDGFGIKVCELSRFVKKKQFNENLTGIASGEIKIVIATHSIISGKIRFDDLGLVIVDEEQHFGVKQKEFVKSINPSAHFMTLSATPIPRTLQLAVTGVKDLSMITTPPISRLPVKTICCDFDKQHIVDAIDAEIKLGGQVFFVTPRVEYLDDLYTMTTRLFPNLRIAVVHGKSGKLEETVMDFCNHKIDIMISTNIIDSGIDIPNANTILIHRFDLFGLSQIYQLRGRVGRSTRQAYAYLLLDPHRTVTDNAMARLDVLQKLNTLGSGVNLANYDLELRGPGNLLGSDQSGFIVEVGVELYQSMLQEAILMLKAGFDEVPPEKKNPKISLGVPVLIPDSYIQDINLRLETYRRIGALKDEEDVYCMEFELSDRFGRIPYETRNLLDLMRIKINCVAANIEKLDVAARGLTFSFFENKCCNTGALLSFLHSDIVKVYCGNAKVRPDHRIVIVKNWPSIAERTLDVIALTGALNFTAPATTST
ncbi:MAG: transcription-repair coupling factor [Holosporales bacterium]|jgi:transcription-repair coupling factor (superfamily II helicase)|nr:transcription-repair coupling factor [Holosporales bacterium]